MNARCVSLLYIAHARLSLFRKSSKPQQYVTDPALAERWISEIRALISTDVKAAY